MKKIALTDIPAASSAAGDGEMEERRTQHRQSYLPRPSKVASDKGWVLDSLDQSTRTRQKGMNKPQKDKEHGTTHLDGVAAHPINQTRLECGLLSFGLENFPLRPNESIVQVCTCHPARNVLLTALSLPAVR